MTIFYWCCSLFLVLEEAPNHSTDSPSSSRAIKGLSSELHLKEHNKSAFDQSKIVADWLKAVISSKGSFEFQVSHVRGICVVEH